MQAASDIRKPGVLILPPYHINLCADCRVLIARRSGDGDSKEELIVTYRSMAATVKYVPLISQPVFDFDAQRKRMKALRQKLRWNVIGCDLLECFDEDN